MFAFFVFVDGEVKSTGWIFKQHGAKIEVSRGFLKKENEKYILVYEKSTYKERELCVTTRFR